MAASRGQRNNNMSERLRFLAYCIEIYKAAKHISGKQAYELFRDHDVLDYVMDSAGALHTTGAEYIVNDIDEFMKTARTA
jgi:hypothetical protein